MLFYCIKSWRLKNIKESCQKGAKGVKGTMDVKCGKCGIKKDVFGKDFGNNSTKFWNDFYLRDKFQ